ncbi:MAG: TIGR04190 family B12-binding domain/radical SAM domain protein, partial [Candidatus Bathyarchaeota archaeon]
MPDLDLILLHAPSVYDFRERPTMYGPISDVIPSTPVFEMYPLGWVSMVGYLEQHGYHARIINLAVKMLKDPSLDVERLITKLDAKAFGFDLHWLAHAAGSLDLAAMVKRHHGDKPVLLGGFSSTYFHEEIIGHFPQIDYILRGDSTENPLLDLMAHIEAEREPERVENLTWRSREGRKRVNPLSYVPEDIDDLFIDYGEVVRLVLRHRDLESTLPFESFMDYPFTALFTCKGCNYNCRTCGGSNYAFKRFFNRERPVFKSPEKLVEEMNIVSEYFKAPLFLIGDLRQGGMNYAEAVLNSIKKEGIDNTVTLELFEAANEDYMKRIAESCESFTLEISPESHDDRVRKLMGKPYTTSQMEKTIKNALDYGCGKFDVFFMVGLPGQTSESALKSVEYSERLYKSLGDDPRVYTFTAPMAPFLDPGSIIFEDPRENGYTLQYGTLREHKEALYQPSWKLYLNYRTDWMTRDQMTETTYEAMIRMNVIKSQKGITTPEDASKIDHGLRLARDVMRRIDRIVESTSDPGKREAKFDRLKLEIQRAKESTVYSKKELRVPGTARIKLRGALKFLLRRARG